MNGVSISVTTSVDHRFSDTQVLMPVSVSPTHRELTHAMACSLAWLAAEQTHQAARVGRPDSH